jgi:hypothetical protein
MTLPAPPRICVPDEGDDSEDGNDTALMDALDSKYFVMVKLIVCSPCLIAAQFRVDTIFKVAVCRPGSSSWSVPQCPFPWRTDIAFYQGKLYAITCTGYLLALNISVDDNTGDPQFTESEEIGFEVIIKGDCKTEIKIDDYNFMRMVYLVESHGSLLMVSRRIFEGHIHGKGQIQTFAEQCEPEVVVLEADFERSRWAKVTSLGDDQVLFLGPCSRAVCMPQWESVCGSWMTIRIITQDTNVGAGRVLVLNAISCLTITLGTSVRAATMLMVWQTTSRSRICQ